MAGIQDPSTPRPPPAATHTTAAPAASTPSALDNLVAQMGTAQLLIVGSALVLLAVDILLGWLVGQYFIGEAAWLGAGLVVLGFALTRFAPRLLPFGYQSLLLVGALVIAITGVRGAVLELLSVLRAPGQWDAIELMGFVLYTGAVVAAGVGAWMMVRGQR
jgi:hypothetical protein